ncbi:MAG: 1-deoxy-D-xylulose-5-phosphate synthase, partial [Opitutales bacterium]|nr:1-deoxy-D-xylulose-5-phosphate synthase [Opitutales bacterium]
LGAKVKDVPAEIEIGKAEVLESGNGKICVWSLGSMLPTAKKLCEKIFEATGTRATLVNARFVKPLDGALLAEQAKTAKLFVTLEDHALAGGFGSAVLEELAARNLSVPVERFGWPDKFVPHGTTVGDLRSRFGLDDESVAQKVLTRISAV